MKPVHVGLLVLGAALAGGLAVKMTQPPPIPAVSATPVTPSAAAAPAPTVQQPVVTIKKPSPLPAPVAASSPAPPVIYTEPVRRPETAHPAIVRPAVVAPGRREEIAQARPLDVPPLPAETPSASPAKVVEAAPVPVQAAPAKVIQPSPAPERPPTLHRVTLQPGMTIMVRLDEALSSDRSVAGNTFTASLVEPIVVDGLVIAERGARVTGRVLDSQKAGRISGVSMMELALSSVTTSDGQRVSIATDPWTKRSDTLRGAALGAIVATRGTPVEVPGETVVAFRVSYAVTITERRAI